MSVLDKLAKNKGLMLELLSGVTSRDRRILVEPPAGDPIFFGCQAVLFEDCIKKFDIFIDESSAPLYKSIGKCGVLITTKFAQKISCNFYCHF